MTKVSFTIAVDCEKLELFELLCDEMDIDMEKALNHFIDKAIAERRLPIELSDLEALHSPEEPKTGNKMHDIMVDLKKGCHSELLDDMNIGI